MKAFILDKFKNSALRFGEMPEPALRDDEVLVAIHAAGLNLLDSKIRSGEFKPILPYRPPFILGHDLAGIVVRVPLSRRTPARPSRRIARSTAPALAPGIAVRRR